MVVRGMVRIWRDQAVNAKLCPDYAGPTPGAFIRARDSLKWRPEENRVVIMADQSEAPDRRSALLKTRLLRCRYGWPQAF